jgi:hypothetical protein
MRALRREGFDRVADLQRALAVTDEQVEQLISTFEQGMEHVRRARAMTEDRRATLPTKRTQDHPLTLLNNQLCHARLPTAH